MRIRDARFFSGVGRMKPGVSITQAQQDLARVQTELGRQFPQTDKDWSAVAGDLKEARVGNYRRALIFVFGAVALLMLIALANIAGLTLTSLHRRAKELAIRSSIGGTRLQVIRAVTREIVVLSVLGALLGCAASMWLLSFAAKMFTEMPRPEGFHLNWEALLFAAVAGGLVAVLCGVLPAIRATSDDLAATLAQGGRGGSGDRHRWQWALAATQVAITVVLLSSAALMLRSYYNLSHVDLGFDANHTLTFHVGAAWDEDRKRIGQIQEQLLAKLESLPGVEAAGFANFLPTTGATLRYQLVLDGIAKNDDSGKITVGERSIGGNYVKAMGASMIAGASCPDLRTVASTAPKALVSRRFAEQYGKGQTLVGQHFKWTGDMASVGSTEIIGVVGNLREDTLNTDPAPYAYVCFAPGGWPDPEYVVRTHGDARALMNAIRPLVRGVDATRAVFGLRMVEDVVSENLEQPRLDMQMITGFALAAIALASIGLYSLVTLLVTSRTREIGVRMTLGAQPSQIVGQIMGGVGRLVGVGVAAGLVLTWLADRVLRSLLFGVTPMDPLSIAGAAVALAVAASLAVLAPARRATKIDPMEAMRTE